MTYTNGTVKVESKRRGYNVTVYLFTDESTGERMTATDKMLGATQYINNAADARNVADRLAAVMVP